MNKLSWKHATLGQLYEIAFHDTGCKASHRIEAKAEIQRRNQAKRQNIKYTEKR